MKTFYEKFKRLKKKGYTEKQMAGYFGMNVKDFRVKVTEEKKKERKFEEAKAKELKDQGMSLENIAKELNLPLRTVCVRLNMVGNH